MHLFRASMHLRGNFSSPKLDMFHRHLCFLPILFAWCFYVGFIRTSGKMPIDHPQDFPLTTGERNPRLEIRGVTLRSAKVLQNIFTRWNSSLECLRLMLCSVASKSFEDRRALVAKSGKKTSRILSRPPLRPRGGRRRTHFGGGKK